MSKMSFLQTRRAITLVFISRDQHLPPTHQLRVLLAAVCTYFTLENLLTIYTVLVLTAFVAYVVEQLDESPRTYKDQIVAALQKYQPVDQKAYDRYLELANTTIPVYDHFVEWEKAENEAIERQRIPLLPPVARM